MSTNVFVRIPTELVDLHHVDEPRRELKVAVDLHNRSIADVVRSGSSKLADRLVRHGFELGRQVPDETLAVLWFGRSFALNC